MRSDTAILVALLHSLHPPCHSACLAWVPAVAAGIAVWLGNEALGISEEAMANAGVVITIPMRGMVESLNVAAAAAVLMSEITRQTTSTVTQPT